MRRCEPPEAPATAQLNLKMMRSKRNGLARAAEHAAQLPTTGAIDICNNDEVGIALCAGGINAACKRGVAKQLHTPLVPSWHLVVNAKGGLVLRQSN